MAPRHLCRSSGAVGSVTAIRRPGADGSIVLKASAMRFCAAAASPRAATWRQHSVEASTFGHQCRQLEHRASVRGGHIAISGAARCSRRARIDGKRQFRGRQSIDSRGDLQVTTPFARRTIAAQSLVTTSAQECRSQPTWRNRHGGKSLSGAITDRPISSGDLRRGGARRATADSSRRQARPSRFPGTVSAARPSARRARSARSDQYFHRGESGRMPSGVKTVAVPAPTPAGGGNPTLTPRPAQFEFASTTANLDAALAKPTSW